MSSVVIGQGNTNVLLSGSTAANTGEARHLVAKDKTFQVIITATATVIIEASNDPRVETDLTNAVWVTLYTDSSSAGHYNAEPWKYYRARVSSYGSGSITVYAGM